MPTFYGLHVSSTLDATLRKREKQFTSKIMRMAVERFLSEAPRSDELKTDDQKARYITGIARRIREGCNEVRDKSCITVLEMQEGAPAPRLSGRIEEHLNEAQDIIAEVENGCKK